MDLSLLKFKLNKLKEKYNMDKGKLEALLERKELKESEKKAKEEYLITLEQARILLQRLSEHQRRKACKKIEELGTYALQHIFGTKFRLEINITSGRKSEAEIYVVSEENGREVRNTPQDHRGGGIVDIVSLALKIVVLETYEPSVDGPIILDEPGKHVSSDHIELLANFLKEISRRFDRQVILITHNSNLAEAADAKYHVALQKGRSVVERI